MEKTLLLIADHLNEHNIHWAVGGSLMLQHHHLVENPRDIDLVVSIHDIVQTDEILTSLGNKKKQTHKKEYATQYFYEYEIFGLHVDVMAGFSIIHEQGVYTYPFDRYSISNTVTTNDIAIPFCVLEDWFILYQLMPNRQDKVDLIEAFLNQQTIINEFVLRRALEQVLPSQVVCSTTQLLK